MIVASIGNRRAPILNGAALSKASRSRVYRGIVSARNPEQGRAGTVRHVGRFHLDACGVCGAAVWVGPVATGMRIVCQDCP